MDQSDKLNRVVDARMKLKARFEERMRKTPSGADDRPQGKGDLNRHGMPSLPVGQVLTVKWPVLDLGIEPEVSTEEWTLKVDGAVDHSVTLTWADFMALPQTEDTSDFHCVTAWSKLNMNWKGVRLMDLAALV